MRIHLLQYYNNYYAGSVARRGAYFGSSSYGPVSVGNTQCSGSETRLQDCDLSQTPGSACTHSQDAGVTCVGKRLVQIFFMVDAVFGWFSLPKW